MAGKSFKWNQREIDRMFRDFSKRAERAQRRYPVRLRAEMTATPPAASAQADGIESDPYLSRAVLWLDEQATLHPGQYQSIADFAETEGIASDQAESLVLQLDRHGLADVLRTLGPRDGLLISDEGKLQAQRLKRLRTDHASRFTFACEALLRCLYDLGRDQEPVELSAFIESSDSCFAGEYLPSTDVVRALSRLEQRGLAIQVGSEDEPASTKAKITDEGIDCVLSGGAVNSPQNHQQRGGDTYTFHNSSGIVAGAHGSVVQNNTFGVDPAALRDFADVVRQFAPTFGASAELEAEIVHDAEVLTQETTDGAEFEPGRIKAAYEKLMQRLEEVGSASAGLSVVLQRGEEAFRTVFGG